MVKIYKSILMMLLLSAAAVTHAQQGKIAVLDQQMAIFSTDEAQKRLKALSTQPDFDQSKKELDKLKKEYEDMVKQLQKDMAVMSADQKEAQGKKLEAKRSDIEHVGRKLQASQQEVLQELMQNMQNKFTKVVSDIIKSENIGLLLDSRVAMHVDNSYNITNKVTEALNKAN